MSEYNVKFLRFRYTMEEIIGRVINETDEEITVSQPVTLVPDPQRPKQLGFLPWAILCADRDITLQKSDILFVGSVPESLEKGYMSATSGIQIANVVPPVGKIQL